MLYSVDVLIVGAGLYGSIIACEAIKKRKKVLVLDRRQHIAGNAYTQIEDGIIVHKYGAHIFHTNNRSVWNYLNTYTEFNHFVNAPIAKYKGQIFNLPFNMNTFYAIWGVTTPQEAERMINSQRKPLSAETLEDMAISLVGVDVYEKLIKGYTEKQWGRKCSELPADIIRRVPVRYTYDNNYYTDKYQGIPEEGYTVLVEKLLDGSSIMLGIDYLKDPLNFYDMAKLIVFTGTIDEFYNYRYGELKYRGLRFESEKMNISNFQGNAVVNYTDINIPYTRIIEHKHFANRNQLNTIITREYPSEWSRGDEPFYPVCDNENMQRYTQYEKLAKVEKKVRFGGRLGSYRYLDMHQVIEQALCDAHAYFS